MNKPRLNHQIRSEFVRIPESAKGVMSHAEAMRLATDAGLDLIEIAPNANPPVCVIMEYGKWQYEQTKKAKANKQKTLETKSVQIRPVTERGDLETKARQINQFLSNGHKVQIIVKLHGRELMHESEAQDKLDELIEMCNCVIELRSKLENKQITALIAKPRIVSNQRDK